MFLAVLPFLIILGIFIYWYIQWLLNNQEDIQYYLAPVWILFTCLLLGGLSQNQVLTQAIVEGYSSNRGWGDYAGEPFYYQPYYKGEDIPVKTLGLAPLIGLVILLLLLPRTQRKTQAIHFIVLLIFVYPWGCAMVLNEIGDRPKLYQEKEELPAVGTRMPKGPHPTPYQ